MRILLSLASVTEIDVNAPEKPGRYHNFGGSGGIEQISAFFFDFVKKNGFTVHLSKPTCFLLLLVHQFQFVRFLSKINF